MEKYKLEEQKAILTLLYNQGADQFSKEAKETKTYKEYKKLKEFRKFIDQEAEKRNYDDPLKLTDYFAEHKKELIDLLEKSPEVFEPIAKLKKLPVRFKKHYISSELIKLSQNLFETQKLNKKGKSYINVDFTEGEIGVEVWEGKNTNYYIKIADLPELKGKPPKMYVNQMKNFYLLMGLIQEQQFFNDRKEANCKFTLVEYAKRRGYTEEQLKDGGEIYDYLKSDLVSGAFTNYKIKKLKLHGEFYTWLGSMYGVGKPDKPKGEWEISFNFPYSKMILSVLEGEARPYFVKNPKAIEDRMTDRKPYLFLFYVQLTKRKQKILTTQPIKIKSLLEDMKLSKYITDRSKECFKVLKECIIYFSENYQPTPEIESFNLYNDFHKTETLKLPLSISEAFKKYSYEDFKDLLKSIGIKDIREAYISFKRPHTKSKSSKYKLSEKDKELRDDILEWIKEWEKLRNYPIEKTEKERHKYISDRIRTLGYELVNDLFKDEKNKKRPNAFHFLFYTLTGEDNPNDWDYY
jgi:hypothetical protein